MPGRCRLRDDLAARDQQCLAGVQSHQVLSHCPTVCSHLVNVFLPLPFSVPLPQVPGQGSSGCLSGPGPAPVGQAPCVFPIAWPPPIKATVSESFMFCVAGSTQDTQVGMQAVSVSCMTHVCPGKQTLHQQCTLQGQELCRMRLESSGMFHTPHGHSDTLLHSYWYALEMAATH